MRIPKTFNIFGQKIVVVWDNNLARRDDARGLAQHRRLRIVLQAQNADNPRTLVEQTFWHEKLHHALNLTNLGDKLTDKEVDTLAGALHQAQITERQ